MPETGAAIAAYFGSSATAATAAEAGVAAAGTAGAATGAAAGAATVAGETALTSALTAAGTSAAGAAASALLAPKPPDENTKRAIAMPDPLAQDEARRKSITEQLARRGRASTILTDAPSQKLGG